MKHIEFLWNSEIWMEIMYKWKLSKHKEVIERRMDILISIKWIKEGYVITYDGLIEYVDTIEDYYKLLERI